MTFSLFGAFDPRRVDGVRVRSRNGEDVGILPERDQVATVLGAVPLPAGLPRRLGAMAAVWPVARRRA